MNIASYIKTSLIEVPDNISTVIFVNGCNFKCGFCYNSWLLENQKSVDQKEIFEFLKTRENKIEYVAVTGGEPTLQEDLIDFFAEIKKLNFKTALETNGSNPKVIRSLLNANLLDYIAMDIKTDLQHYKTFLDNTELIEQSANLLLNSKINYEFRTTMVPAYIDRIKFRNMVQLIDGAKNYYLQQFRNQETLNPEFREIKPYTEKELLEFKRMANPHVDKCQLRL